MLEKIVYTIRDQSSIFQLAILSSLAGTREYIMYCSLKNQALSSHLTLLPHVVIANNMSEQNKYFLVLYPSEKRQVSIAGLNK
jgi:hypothetical protein